MLVDVEFFAQLVSVSVRLVTKLPESFQTTFPASAAPYVYLCI